MGWREIANDDQPLTVTAATVKDFLLRFRQQRMADWLDSQMDMPKKLAQQLQQQRDWNKQLQERLHKYEPPAAEPVPRSYRAGPMSDG